MKSRVSFSKAFLGALISNGARSAGLVTNSYAAAFATAEYNYPAHSARVRKNKLEQEKWQDYSDKKKFYIVSSIIWKTTQSH